jgi:DNA-binding transcriptional MerR regulator
MNTQLTIQSMAERCGLTAHTLRYYERVGLIQPIHRAENGHRRYSAEDEAWIGFLNRLRATGMPIRKMQRYAELRLKGDSTAAERRQILEEHRSSIEEKIHALQDCHALLSYKIVNYHEIEEKLNGQTCPIMQVEGVLDEDTALRQ